MERILGVGKKDGQRKGEGLGLRDWRIGVVGMRETVGMKERGWVFERITVQR